MRGWNLYSVADLRFEDVKMPVPSDEEVIVKVEAAGICGSDVPRIYRNGTYHFPAIPGHEFAGTVYSEEGGLAGKRVGIFPLIPCGVCPMCKAHSYEMCENYNYLGSRCDGGFAEYVKVPVWNLIELDENVSFEEGAMMEPLAVAIHAVRGILGGRIKPLEWKLTEGADPTAPVMVSGIGAIGLLVMMVLRSLGFENISCIGTRDLQFEMAGKLGIDPDDIYSTDDFEGRGAAMLAGQFAYAFETAGTRCSLERCLDCASPGGRVMLVGNPLADMNLDKNIYWKILRKQLTLKGSWNSYYDHAPLDDWNIAMKLMGQGLIRPNLLISHRFSLEDLDKGLDIMRNKREDYIKIIIVN
ncbi:galactitol-1-phosphate 5-dehydrogenase [Butyrivibrio sp. MC2013]|uniref:galactitol-1-phosphate 5-dehydrogenase n=1 Tax=Butyrivibrio sp. MC2013 TaxID=1280686 RepID=UPI00041398AB|nr:galactitol-1-phosphate 5-dehydrogenase [Butyrivibrio sp. MC2013]